MSEAKELFGPIHSLIVNASSFVLDTGSEAGRSLPKFLMGAKAIRPAWKGHPPPLVGILVMTFSAALWDTSSHGSLWALTSKAETRFPVDVIFVMTSALPCCQHAVEEGASFNIACFVTVRLEFHWPLTSFKNNSDTPRDFVNSYHCRTSERPQR